MTLRYFLLTGFRFFYSGLPSFFASVPQRLGIWPLLWLILAGLQLLNPTWAVAHNSDWPRQMSGTSIKALGSDIFVSQLSGSPTLGSYPATSVSLNAQTTVTPVSPPTNATSVVALASSGFNGILTVDPTTGIIKVTNPQPAGIYSVTVTAFGATGSGTSTFTLTVESGTNCTTSPLFTAASNLTVSTPLGVAVGDFNNDGKQDLVTANGSFASASVRLGDGTGGFTGSTTVSTSSNPIAIAIGDFNGDGNQDLAVVCSTNTVSIRLGDGAGNFSGTTNISTGQTSKHITLGDFNGDGKLDFLTANIGSDNVSVRFGDGSGGFSGSTNVSVGFAPGSVVAGDFDGDGDLDFATSNQWFNSSNGTFSGGSVSVRLNDGVGGFSGSTEITVGTNPENMALGDFNKDGKSDLVTSNQNTNYLSVLLGDASGNFTGPTNLTVTSGPGQVLAADVNNDGNPDIVFKGGQFEQIVYLLGNGTGGFATPVAFTTTGAFGTKLALGDFNGDGRQDFVTNNFGTNLLAVRLGGCSTPPTIAGFAPTAATVCAGNVATFTATIGNITGSYNYTLTKGSNPVSGTATSTAFSQTLTASGTGTQAYSLIVGSNGGTTFVSTTLTVNAVPSLTITTSPSLSITSGNTVTLIASGASSYTWTGNVQSATFTASPTTTTTYSLTGLNVSGCSSVTSVTVTVNTPGCYSVIYVTQNGLGLQNGSSWANAYPGTQLQTAIDAVSACGGGQVWVAAGLYKPTITSGPDSRTISFWMRNNVAIYGGFAGTETSLTGPTGRTLTIPSSTTFSGEIGNTSSLTDNSHHVVVAAGLDNTARLDGVVITRGNSDAPVSLNFTQLGGGVFITQSINAAQSPGCILANCTIESNTATYGGGVCNYIGNPSIINCVFKNNVATAEGGGFYAYLSFGILTNSVLQSNSATEGGGGISANTSIPLLTNCTLKDNSAPSGGGILYVGIPSPTLALTLTNSIVWNNGGANSFSVTDAIILADHTLFEPASITIAGVDANGPGNLITTVSPFASATSVALNACTSAIDAGSNSATGLTGISTDLIGNNRIFGGTVDMGAVEFQAPSGSFTTTLSVGPSSTLTCARTSLTLTATGGTSYTFAGPGVLSQNATAGTAVVNASGTYSVTAMNTSGCTAVSNSVTISQNTAAPTNASLTAGNSSTLTCSAPTLTLTASAVGTSLTYVFGGPLGILTGSGNTRPVSVSGLYSVTITGANGCTTSASTMIYSNTSTPTAGLMASGTLTCSNLTVALTATGGGGAYSFSGPGIVSQNTTAGTAVVNQPGTYSVLVTNTATGCSSQTTLTVDFQNTGTLSASLLASTTALSCSSPSALLTATPASAGSYLFSGPGLNQTGASNTAPASTTGVYSVTAGAGACASTASVTLVGVPGSAPNALLVGTGDLSCTTPTLTLTATGGSRYSFSGPGIVSQTDGRTCIVVGNYLICNTPIPTMGTAVVNRPGTYTVVVTGEGGCTATATLVVTGTECR